MCIFVTQNLKKILEGLSHKIVDDFSVFQTEHYVWIGTNASTRNIFLTAYKMLQNYYILS